MTGITLVTKITGITGITGISGITGITGITGVTAITEITGNPKNINYSVSDNFKSRDASASKNLLDVFGSCLFFPYSCIQLDSRTS